MPTLRRAGLPVVVVTLALFLALSGCGSSNAKTAAKPNRPKPAEDLAMTDADFVNLRDMTPVRGFFVANRLGHLKQTLAVANNPKGGTYPVGTILQLVPQEAMVKRAPGFNPKTHDWEFFFLETSGTGTKIAVRGSTEVKNRFGGNCFACHALAQSRFDLVCEKTHGCEPLPVGDDVIHAVQEADPRPRTTAGN